MMNYKTTIFIVIISLNLAIFDWTSPHPDKFRTLEEIVQNAGF